MQHRINTNKGTLNIYSLPPTQNTSYIIMEEVSTANRLLKSTLDSHESDLVQQIAELDSWERTLTERMDKLNKTKYETAHAYGNEYAADDDLIEINAGGKVISAKRSTLTQLKGTRFEGEYLVYVWYT